MKLAFTSTTLLVLGCVSASAADLAYTKAPPVVDAVYNWTGFYVGGHAGYAWAPTSYNHNETAGVGGAILNTVGYNPEPSGFAGGGQVGYQYQFSNRFVIGVEGAYSWFDQSASAAVLAGRPRIRTTTVGDMWSVAGRLGYSFGTSLLYVKGGYANSELSFANTLNATGALLGGSSTRVDGFVVGTGLEYAFAPNWSVAGEYNFYSFDAGRQQQVLLGVAQAAYNDAIDFNIHQVLVKLNYRFGG